MESNITALQATRSAKLVDAEGPEEVLAIDRAITAERANAEIYKDKITALQEECRKITYAEREEERWKSIAKIKERLKKRESLAVQLQLALETVGKLYVELTGRDEVELEWPVPKPGFGFAALDRRGVDRELGWALYGLVQQHRLPEASSSGLGVLGVVAQGIDGAVRANNENRPISGRHAVGHRQSDLGQGWYDRTRARPHKCRYERGPYSLASASHQRLPCDSPLTGHP